MCISGAAACACVCWLVRALLGAADSSITDAEAAESCSQMPTHAQDKPSEGKFPARLCLEMAQLSVHTEASAGHDTQLRLDVGRLEADERLPWAAQSHLQLLPEQVSLSLS